MTLNEDISAILSDISAENPMEIVIDRVDANGNLTTSKREYITATAVSGAVISGITRNADGSGSDQEHSVGAVVEFIPGTLWANSVTDYAMSEDGTQTLTNKTIDGDDNTVQDLPYDAIKSTSRTGADAKLVTGTEGTDGFISKWNADGDLVDGFEFFDEDDMASDDAAGVASQQSIKAYTDAVSDAVGYHDYYFYADEDTVQGLTTGETVIYGDNEVDPSSNYVAASGVYTAPVAGVYTFTARIRWDNVPDANSCHLGLYSGGIVALGSYFRNDSGGNLDPYADVSAVLVLAAEATVEVKAYHTTGGDLNTNPSVQSTNFSGSLITRI